MKKAIEVVIVLAEDDHGHAELIKDGLVEAGICNKLIRFANGDETLQFLFSHAAKSRRTGNINFLLVLDINMPKTDGIEVLRKIKGDEELKEIPVVMLTTTDDPREIEKCYELGCNFYISKPIDFFHFSDVIKRLGLFIQIVKF